MSISGIMKQNQSKKEYNSSFIFLCSVTKNLVCHMHRNVICLFRSRNINIDNCPLALYCIQVWDKQFDAAVQISETINHQCHFWLTPLGRCGATRSRKYTSTQVTVGNLSHVAQRPKFEIQFPRSCDTDP